MDDKDRFYKHVGEKIRAARGKGLSQEALAAAVGLTRTSISNIEKGRQRLLLHTLVDLAATLKVTPASLLPDRNMLATAAGMEALAGLPEKERTFIEAAIGIVKREGRDHGSQAKEDPRSGGDVTQAESGFRTTCAGLGDRSKERGAARG